MSGTNIKMKRLKEKIAKLLKEKEVRKQTKEEKNIITKIEKEIEEKERYYSISLTIPKRPEKVKLSPEAMKLAKELEKALKSVRFLNKVWV